MSLKSRNKQRDTSIAVAAKNAHAAVELEGNSLTNKATVQSLTASMENLNDSDYTRLVSSLESAERHLEESFGDMLSVEQFIDPLSGNHDQQIAEAQRLRKVALESGAIAALASADPAGYARVALNTAASAPADGRLISPLADGPAGSMDYGTKVSAEAYDESELHKYIQYSIAFNTFAARQDAFSEGFYPTIVVSADQGGADLSVRRQRVFDNGRHALTGKETNFGFRNLLSAAVDSTILADQSTRLVPYRDPTVPAPEFLLNEDQFGQYTVKIAGVDVDTAPYKFGKTMDLLGLSAYAPLMGSGVMDFSDAVAARATLTSVYLDQGLDNDDAQLPVIAFQTAGLHRSSFVGALEGRDRELNLHFPFNDIIIDKNTKAVDGSAVTALATIGNHVVYARSTVTGRLDTQFGTLDANASPISVTRIVDGTGSDISLTTGAGLALKNAIEGMAWAGYDISAYRTNSNRRTPGKRLDVETIRERYTVLVGPPMSVQRPATADADAVEQEALINAVRLRNSNNAVTALLNYADLLRSVVRGPRQQDIPEIAGLGRLLVKPFYEELTLDMKLSMNSIKTHERAEDISATLIQAIRDMSYRMYQYSEIQAALDSANPTGNETPNLLIGTDQILVRHLMVQGDTRTFGTQFSEARVVVSQDKRVRHHIYLTFTRNKNLEQLDALRFGTHLWIPELVSRMQVYRDGGTHLEAMVQARNLHVNHLPILGKIKVINLPDALVNKTLQPAIATDLTNPWLEGIVFDTSSDD